MSIDTFDLCSTVITTLTILSDSRWSNSRKSIDSHFLLSLINSTNGLKYGKESSNIFMLFSMKPNLSCIRDQTSDTSFIPLNIVLLVLVALLISKCKNLASS